MLLLLVFSSVLFVNVTPPARTQIRVSRKNKIIKINKKYFLIYSELGKLASTNCTMEKNETSISGSF